MTHVEYVVAAMFCVPTKIGQGNWDYKAGITSNLCMLVI